MSLTAFQSAAADKIRRLGGSIYYRDDKSFRDGHGARVSVPDANFKTEGFIGWPTIKALVDDGTMRGPLDGSKYVLA